jgi:hypothetical protein
LELFFSVNSIVVEAIIGFSLVFDEVFSLTTPTEIIDWLSFFWGDEDGSNFLWLLLL